LIDFEGITIVKMVNLQITSVHSVNSDSFLNFTGFNDHFITFNLYTSDNKRKWKGRTMKKVVLGLAGMPGAGKGAFRRFVQKIGYPVVIMGNEIRNEAKRRKLEPTPENLGKVMLQLREAEGQATVAKRCIPKLQNAKERIVVVDGIRSLHEVEEFKKYFPNFTLIALHASPKTRYQRLTRRRRSDDPASWETFMQRDLREIGVGLGAVIATADYMIVNEGTLTQLRKKIQQVLKEALRDG
jgi:dephospho-CoA kinase